MREIAAQAQTAWLSSHFRGFFFPAAATEPATHCVLSAFHRPLGAGRAPRPKKPGVS